MPLPKVLRRLFGEPEAPVAAEAAPPVQGYDLLFGRENRSKQGHATTKFVVILGNCFAEEMERGLTGTPEAAKKFKFFAVPLHIKPIGSADVKAIFNSADYVFVQKFAAGDMDSIRQITPSHCEFIVYPDIAMRSPWPFDDYSGLRDEKIDATQDCVFHNHDGALAALRLKIPDKKKRFEAYRDLEFERANRIDTVVEAQARYLASIDEDSDAFLGRFVSRHYQETQLFYNSGHPSGMVFRELCSYVMRKLQLPDGISVRPSLDNWRTWSVPVHPKIAQRLGLKWAHEFTRYEYGTLGKVTWAEWVKAYIEILG